MRKRNKSIIRINSILIMVVFCSCLLFACGTSEPITITVNGESDVSTEERSDNSDTKENLQEQEDSSNTYIATVANRYGLWGAIDSKGNYVIEQKYEQLGSFSEEGLAIATLRQDDVALYGIIDLNENWLYPPSADIKPEQLFDSQGYAPAFYFNHETNESGKGFIDRNGKWVIDPVYGLVDSFAENGLARVMTKQVGATAGTWGYIDRGGNWVLEPIYSDAGDFSPEGVAFVTIPGEGKVCIDAAGNILFTEVHDDTNQMSFPTYVFSQGCTLVKGQGGFGIVNSRGDVVVSCDYKNIKFYHGSGPNRTLADIYGCVADNGTVCVSKEDKYFYIDTRGNMIVDGDFSDAFPFHNGYAYVKDGQTSLWGYINESGEYVISPRFEDVTVDKTNFYLDLCNFSENGLVAFSKSDEGVAEYGFMDNKGNEVIEAQFRDAKPFVKVRK